MPNSKITDLTDLTAAAGDEIPVNRAGSDGKVTAEEVANTATSTPNLVTIQSRTVTLADAGADAFLGWDDSQSAYENLTAAEAVAIIDTADSWLKNVVEDTTPELGGNLDANASNIGFDDATGITDDSGNEQLIFQKTASAVNYWEMTNAATGNAPILSVAGSDADICMRFSVKGDATGGGFPDYRNPSVEFYVGDFENSVFSIRQQSANNDGPYLVLFKDDVGSGVDAGADVNDFIGGFEYLGKGNGSTNLNIVYSGIWCQAVDVTDGSEDGRMIFYVCEGGQGYTRQMILGRGCVIGPGSEISVGEEPGHGNLGFHDNRGIYTVADGHTGGTEQLIFQHTTSAVNYWEMTNSATGGVQRLAALGDDTDIAVTIASKGTDPINFEVNGNTEAALTASSFSPGANDGNALGTTSLGWADLHLATGGVINWANGEVTLTETDANTLTVAGATAVSLGTSAAFTTGTIELGHASSNTLDVSGGNLRLEGTVLYKTGGVPGTIGITIDGGGSAITTGVKGYVTVPYACTLTEWYLTGDTSGAIKIDVWREDFAGGVLPDNSDSITNANEPEIVASGVMASDTDISNWTDVTLDANDILGFNVDSCTSITKATLVLKTLR